VRVPVIQRFAPIKRMAEYAIWDESLPDIVPDSTLAALPGKYSSTVSHILSKHCTEVKLSSEELCQSLTAVAKKKLKDLIVKHNNALFSFMSNPDNAQHTSHTPPSIGQAEMIFRRYGYDIPTIKGNDRKSMLKELNLSADLDHVIAEFTEKLPHSKEDASLPNFMKQMRWLFQQYKIIGEEVMRLETNLFQKIEQLDKLHNRLPVITSLTANDALPELMESFTKYINTVYESSQFEENYKDLVEGYKKWNICRQILSLPLSLRQDGAEPQCSICLTESVSYAIVPCGHTFCGQCSRKQNTTCYICRGQIRERVKLFFA